MSLRTHLLPQSDLQAQGYLKQSKGSICYEELELRTRPANHLLDIRVKVGHTEKSDDFDVSQSSMT